MIFSYGRLCYYYWRGLLLCDCMMDEFVYLNCLRVIGHYTLYLKHHLFRWRCSVSFIWLRWGIYLQPFDSSHGFVFSIKLRISEIPHKKSFRNSAELQAQRPNNVQRVDFFVAFKLYVSNTLAPFGLKF